MEYPLLQLEQTDSTNRYLTSFCDKQRDIIEPFTTVMADYQSAGKGYQ